MKVEKIREILGTLSAFQNILENYPKLLADDYYGGKETNLAAISFMLDILEMFGITDKFLYDWLGKLLSDDDNGWKKGILLVIEESVKTILLTYLTGLYTCPVDPALPDRFLRSPYVDKGQDLEYPWGIGYRVPINKIDMLGLLQNCPTTEKGSVFYFDTIESGYTTSEVWKSTDCNAFLWYVVNKGNGKPPQSVWDNRVHYRFQYKDPVNGQNKKDTFVNAECQRSPSRVISGVGVKKQIIMCRFEEGGFDRDNGILSKQELVQSNYIRVWGVADRYYAQGIKLKNEGDTSIESLIKDGRANKTIFQFNTDYISSLKLFDSKTIVAQIINAVLGISNALTASFSLQMNIMVRQIEKIVEKVIEYDTVGGDNVDEEGYFEFSDEEYNEIVNDATIRYNGKYETKNETNDLEDVDVDAITTYIRTINSAQTQEEKEQAIIAALKKTSKLDVDVTGSSSLSRNMIGRFIKEAAVQLSMQILSPKVMLLFAINSEFLGDTQEEITDSVHWEMFFKNFWNFVRSCTRRIADLIIQELFDLVVGQIKPIITLVVKKLMLETIYYYKILLEELITSCTPNINFRSRTENMVIDNVNYADIIPTETTPKQ